MFVGKTMDLLDVPCHHICPRRCDNLPKFTFLIDIITTNQYHAPLFRQRCHHRPATLPSSGTKSNFVWYGWSNGRDCRRKLWNRMCDITQLLSPNTCRSCSKRFRKRIIHGPYRIVFIIVQGFWSIWRPYCTSSAFTQMKAWVFGVLHSVFYIYFGK